MLGTVKKWVGLEVPAWWDEEMQEDYPHPNRQVHFIGKETPYWSSGFSISKADDDYTSIKLHEALWAANAAGYIIFEGFGMERD